MKSLLEVEISALWFITLNCDFLKDFMETFTAWREYHKVVGRKGTTLTCECSQICHKSFVMETL